MTLQERQQLGDVQNANPNYQNMLRDIMLRTRATGNCVESYFQQFGSKVKEGLTEDQFQRAILNLKCPWAEDHQNLQ